MVPIEDREGVGNREAGEAADDGEFVDPDAVEQKRDAIGDAEGEIVERGGFRVQLLEREGAGITNYIGELEQRSPFKQT